MLNREVINTILPEGIFWEPATEDFYDKLLDGIGDNSDAVLDFLIQLRNLRDPWKTEFLEELEQEYAIIPVAGSTKTERRTRLAAIMFRKSKLPTYESLQEKLQAAGFDVQVHANSPAVDPSIFLNEDFQMTAGDLLPGGNDAQAGEPEAYCGSIGGELLANGELYEEFPNYIVLCDEADAQCGETDAQAGNYDSIRTELIEYFVPTDAGYWPLIFFVGGDATRDPVTGEITDIEIAPIPIERRLEFRRIILKYKPMFSWAALIVVYQ